MITTSLFPARLCFLLLGFFLLHPGITFAQVRPRLSQPVDDASRVTLTGNVHPLARAEFDRGIAPPDLPMERMLLVLKRSEEQEADLQKLLQDQQDKSSPRYRHWLTPQEFGAQFGPADEDIQAVTDWLQSQGFHGIHISEGRTMIEFSGTAAQVQSSLKTSIHKFAINGKEHWANSVDPTIPAALSPVVTGLLTLHNFLKKPYAHLQQERFVAKAQPAAHPEFTSTTGKHALMPADYYTIYNFGAYSAPQSSSSAVIAIVGRSNINWADVYQFHSFAADNAKLPGVIVNGPDPGILDGGEETEAVLDTTWAGVTDPSAQVRLVVSQSTNTTDGVDLSELYIIDNNLGDVMSESFGTCEATATNSQATGVLLLAQQAAAQGITYVVSSGDSGAEGCDNPRTQSTATGPLSVNLVASTSYNVAVGGTQFAENGHDATYWKSMNDQPMPGSAISYIPENVWNESCRSGQTGCTNAAIWSGGGGVSKFFTKPSWQTGVSGIPADGFRDIPDVSLTAAAHDPYLICIEQSCVPDSQNLIRFVAVDGTSASAPAFAGIMGLVAQKTGTRLGTPNYILYRLAAAENLANCNSTGVTLPAGICVFNDVTVGNNAVPGESGYGMPGASYQSGVGYDLATGLGSVNVSNLINKWNTISFNPTTTTFTLSPITATHGAVFNVAVHVAPTSGTGNPTGFAWLVSNPPNKPTGSGLIDIFPLDATGSFTGVTHLLPGGTYQTLVHYAGDQTYGGSDSDPTVSISVNPEPTTTSSSVSTKDLSGAFVPFTAGPYGTPLYLQGQVSWASGYGKPVGVMDFRDNNLGHSFYGAQVHADGSILSPPLTGFAAGSYSITATYQGDPSFGQSSSPSTVKFTIGQVGTTTTLDSAFTNPSFLITATVSANSSGSAATGNVTFKSGSTVLGTALLNPGITTNGLAQSFASFDATQLVAGSYSVIAAYSGDNNYTASTSSPLSLNLIPDFQLSAGNPSSQSVFAGQLATYPPLAVNSFFGYSATLTLTCAVPAQGTTCTVSPGVVNVNAGAATALPTVKVKTTSRTASVLAPRILLPISPHPGLFVLLLAIVFALLIQGTRKKHIGVAMLAGPALLLGIVVMGLRRWELLRALDARTSDTKSQWNSGRHIHRHCHRHRGCHHSHYDAHADRAVTKVHRSFRRCRVKCSGV